MSDEKSKPLRILLVGQYFWPEHTSLNDLALGLIERGHEVTVLTGLPNYPAGRIFPGYGWRGPWRENYHGADVFRVPLISRGTKSKLRLVANYLSFMMFSCLIAPFRIKKKHDVVFVYQSSPVTVGYPGLVLARIWRAPLFLWVLDLWPESLAASGMSTSKISEKIARFLARPVYAKSDYILGQSKGFEEPVRATAASEISFRRFPHWGEIRPAKIKSSNVPILPGGFKILFAGNVGASQNFEIVLAAAELLRHKKEAQWVIIGDGHRLEWLKEQIVQRNLSGIIHCLGRYPSTDMPLFYAQADVLFAALRDEPAFALTVPSKIQTYLMAKKPIIAAINGETSRILNESGAGIAVKSEDAEALAAAVERMMLLPENDRRQMGLRGASYAAMHYDRDKLFDELVEWFHEAIAKP